MLNRYFFSALISLCFFGQAQAALFVVNNTGSTGPGSLYDAIQQANGAPGRDTIKFNISGSGVQVIYVPNTLPCLTDNAGLYIDGYSQPGSLQNTNPENMPSNAVLKIMLYSGGSILRGLCISSNDNLIEGLIIYNFGTPTMSLNETGIEIGPSGLAADMNRIRGCFIGVDSTGTNGNSNQDIGIKIGNNAQGNFIGDTMPEARNIISGNTDVGVEINGNNNVVEGNIIGISLLGGGPPSNNFQNTGVRIWGLNNRIGGNKLFHRNIISCNIKAGIDIQADGNFIEGNFIGTKITGQASAGGQDDGIVLKGNNNRIGGNIPGQGNLISGNNISGIQILPGGALPTTDNTIQGNLIGTDSTGTADVGNLKHGIFINGGVNSNGVSSTLIGMKADTNELNVIAFNDSTGIKIIGFPSGNQTRFNTIRRNKIFANNFLGISLEQNGNDLMPAPAITQVNICNGISTVKGTSNPNDTIEIFQDYTSQGEFYIGTSIADGSGNWSITSIPTDPGKNVTATATYNLNTSPFSPFSGVVDEMLLSSMSKTDVSCNGLTDGYAMTGVQSGGQSPYTYYWTPSSQPTASASNLSAGTYTVTVTDNLGCTKTGTVFITEPAILSVSTTETNVSVNGGNDGSATANPSGGTTPYTYNWIPSAQNTQTAGSLSAGSYTVTVTDSKGCTAFNTVAISEPPVFSISGTVFNETYSDTIKQGTVLLMLYNTNNVSMKNMDTVLINSVNGTYLFTGISPNKYVIKTTADTSVYPYTMPTYFGDTLFWKGAKVLDLSSDTSFIDIDVIALPPTTGSGKVQGIVREGNAYQKKAGPGDPLQGVNVSLINKSSGKVEQSTTSDASSASPGVFTFSNIQQGTFYLYADKTGIPVDISVPNTEFTITSTDTTFENVEILVDSNLIYMQTPTVISSFNSQERFIVNKVYPNPARSLIQFEVENNTGYAAHISFKIYDITGTEVKLNTDEGYTLQSGKSTKLLNVSYLSSGIYFIRLTAKDLIKNDLLFQTISRIAIIK